MKDTIVIPSWNGYNREPWYPSLSSDNEYIPIHSLKGSETLTSKNTGRRAMLYNLNFPIDTCYPVGRMGEFIRGLSRDTETWYEFINRAFVNSYFGQRGTIITLTPEPKYLMTIAVKTKYVFDLEKTNPISQTPNNYFSKFCLIIDREFISNIEYFRVYRNVKRGFIDAMQDRIDIIYTNNLHSLCFNPPNDLLPKFKSIGDMVAYTKGITHQVLTSI